MIYQVMEARYLRDYVIHIKFIDGLEGGVDLENELDGLIFSPLKDLNQFKKFKVHPELHTLVWENDADFAPEFQHEIVRIPA